MGCSIAQTAPTVMREGKHLLGQGVTNDSHEILTGCRAAGPWLGVVILSVVAVLVLLILMVPQRLHTLDGELWGGVGRR